MNRISKQAWVVITILLTYIAITSAQQVPQLPRSSSNALRTRDKSLHASGVTGPKGCRELSPGWSVLCDTRGQRQRYQRTPAGRARKAYAARLDFLSARSRNFDVTSKTSISA